VRGGAGCRWGKEWGGWTTRGEVALIATVDEAAAEGELAKVYRHIAGAAGTVAYILKSSLLHPAVLRRHYDLYREVMFGPSPLSRAQREMVATAVSALNGYHY